MEADETPDRGYNSFSRQSHTFSSNFISFLFAISSVMLFAVLSTKRNGNDDFSNISSLRNSPTEMLSVVSDDKETRNTLRKFASTYKHSNKMYSYTSC